MQSYVSGPSEVYPFNSIDSYKISKVNCAFMACAKMYKWWQTDAKIITCQLWNEMYSYIPHKL